MLCRASDQWLQCLKRRGAAGGKPQVGTDATRAACRRAVDEVGALPTPLLHSFPLSLPVLWLWE
jgi:hypothetical protein